MIHDTQISQNIKKRHRRHMYAITETMCPPGHHHNGFVETQALGHVIYGYTLLVTMKRRVLSKLTRDHVISDHK